MENKIELTPIGFVRNRADQSALPRPGEPADWRARAAAMQEQRDAVSEVVVDTGLEEALDGIEEFSHLVILYWPHLLPAESRTVRQVHPMGNADFPLVGIFATQSPARPNPVLTSTVRLLERRGNVLRVVGLDALDGSPVLDIKPHAPGREDIAGLRLPVWMRQVRRHLGEPSS